VCVNITFNITIIGTEFAMDKRICFLYYSHESENPDAFYFLIGKTGFLLAQE